MTTAPLEKKKTLYETVEFSGEVAATD